MCIVEPYVCIKQCCMNRKRYKKFKEVKKFTTIQDEYKVYNTLQIFIGLFIYN